MSKSIRIDGVLFIREWPNEAGQITYWCPACSAGHTIGFGAAETWQWNGDTAKPTFSPSVLTYPHPRSFDPANPDAPAGTLVPPQVRCHSFITDGQIQYLSDCEHALAGQTIDMVPLPERYKNFLYD